jgi:hypothetical protein
MADAGGRVYEVPTSLEASRTDLSYRKVLSYALYYAAASILMIATPP